MKRWRRVLTVVWGLLPAALACPVGAAEPIERFAGTVLDVGAAVPGRAAAFLSLRIDELTTVEKMRELAAILKEQGREALTEALSQLDAGQLRIGSGLGHRAAVIRSVETPGGRRIRVVTDRPISFAEMRRGARSRDYELGILELELDAAGEGEGRLMVAAKVEFDEEGRLEVEILGREPFRVVNVRPEK